MVHCLNHWQLHSSEITMKVPFFLCLILVGVSIKFCQAGEDDEYDKRYSCNKITKTWIQISRQNWNGWFNYLTPIASRSKTKLYKHPKNKKLSFNSWLQTITDLSKPLIWCSFCVFLISLLLYQKFGEVSCFRGFGIPIVTFWRILMTLSERKSSEYWSKRQNASEFLKNTDLDST